MGLDIYIETQPKNDLNNEASRKQVAFFRNRAIIIKATSIGGLK